MPFYRGHYQKPHIPMRQALVLEGGLAISLNNKPDKDYPPRVGYRQYLSLLKPERRPKANAMTEVVDSWAKQVLDAHDQFQVLCAVRKGHWGVEGLNQRIESLLASKGHINIQGDWYEGRPVLVTHNDYALGLMNGDIGVTLTIHDPDRNQPTLRVAFPTYDAAKPIHGSPPVVSMPWKRYSPLQYTSHKVRNSPIPPWSCRIGPNRF